MTYIPNPANYKMKTNPPKIAQEARSIDVADPDAQLTDTELKALVMSQLVKLVKSPMTQAGTLLAACREILDRIEGKPTQFIRQQVEHRKGESVMEMTNEQLMLVLSSAQASNMLPGHIRLIEGKVEMMDITPLDVVTLDVE